MLAIGLISIVLVYVMADEVIVYQKKKELRRQYRKFEEYRRVALLCDHNDIV